MTSANGSSNRSDDGAVTLTIPGRAEFFRLARLAAADTGARAGLSVGDLEDLRIAVDEMAYALIGDEQSGVPMTLRYLASDGLVEIEGACVVNGESSPLSDLARAIVGAVADEHELRDDGDTRRFRLVKRSRG